MEIRRSTQWTQLYGFGAICESYQSLMLEKPQMIAGDRRRWNMAMESAIVPAIVVQDRAEVEADERRQQETAAYAAL